MSRPYAIRKGADSVIFTPYYGEFGWMIMNHLRYVHAHPAKHKIVCCERGNECLFPSASEFIYFDHPIKEDARWWKTVWGDASAVDKHRANIIADLKAKYPHASVDEPHYDCHWHTS